MNIDIQERYLFSQQLVKKIGQTALNPDVVSVAFSRIHPALDVWAVASRDELGATLCELLLCELEYQFVGAEYRERLAAAYNALLQVAELPEELLLSLVRGLKQ